MAVENFSDINTKDDLVSALSALRLFATYDLFGQILLHDFYKNIQTGKSDPTKLIATLPEGKISLAEFNSTQIKAGNSLKAIKRGANIALTTGLLKTVFRLTQSYSEKTSQKSTFTTKSWYHFVRLQTNTLSHNYVYRFENYDLGKLPVTYKGQTLDSSLQGQPLSMTLEIAIGLVDDIISFAKSSLN